MLENLVHVQNTGAFRYLDFTVYTCPFILWDPTNFIRRILFGIDIIHRYAVDFTLEQQTNNQIAHTDQTKERCAPVQKVGG